MSVIDTLSLQEEIHDFLCGSQKMVKGQGVMEAMAGSYAYSSAAGLGTTTGKIFHAYPR